MLEKNPEQQKLGDINNAQLIPKFKGLSEARQAHVNFAETIEREQQQACL